MAEDEETIFCTNCKKDIAAFNYRTHEIHCRRFIQLCTLCNEAVPTQELEEHREREHTQVKCSQCHKIMERCKLETHQAEQCVERMLNCQFCDLETQSRTLLEHEEMCGSRTNRCGDCGKYVMCRDQELHQQTCPREHCSGFASAPVTGKSSKTPCVFCTKMFPEDQLQQHQNGCRPLSGLVDRFQTSLWQDLPSYPSSRSRPRLSYPPFFTPLPREQVGAQAASSSWRSPFMGTEDLDEIGCCPVCDCALPYELLQQHEVKCRLFRRQRRNRLRQRESIERELL